MKETSVRVDGIRSPLLEAGPRGADEGCRFRARFGRAVAMDMPGFGAADKAERFDYSVPGYSRHLGRLLAECDVRHAHLGLCQLAGSETKWWQRSSLLSKHSTDSG